VKTATILSKAADYIEQNGWCRNEFYDPRGQVCLAGAIGRVTGAIKPLSKAARTRKLREIGCTPEQITAALEGRGLYAGTAVWDMADPESTAVADYRKGVAALAEIIPSNDVTGRLAVFDGLTEQYMEQSFYLGLTTKEQAEWRKAREDAREQLKLDIVTTHNDQVDLRQRSGRFVNVGRTTKASAVKLLRRAATTV
jgi:hypothetical protein